MPEENPTICELCQKALGVNGEESHTCDSWCGSDADDRQSPTNTKREL